MREDFHIHVIVKYLQIPQQTFFFYVYEYKCIDLSPRYCRHKHAAQVYLTSARASFVNLG
jgi:hypothetical protein